MSYKNSCLFLSDKLSCLERKYSAASVRTWWIHTAIHPTWQCYHYFTALLIPPAPSLALREWMANILERPAHSFFQLIVSSQERNSWRQKEKGRKAAKDNWEIREAGRRKWHACGWGGGGGCDWVELYSWLIFPAHKKSERCRAEWEGQRHFIELQKMTSFLQTDSITCCFLRQRDCSASVLLWLSKWMWALSREK